MPRKLPPVLDDVLGELGRRGVRCRLFGGLGHGLIHGLLQIRRVLFIGCRLHLGLYKAVDIGIIGLNFGRGCGLGGLVLAAFFAQYI